MAEGVQEQGAEEGIRAKRDAVMGLEEIA
jgi:hypothetical protein